LKDIIHTHIHYLYTLQTTESKLYLPKWTVHCTAIQMTIT